MSMSEEETITIRFRLECYRSTNLGQLSVRTKADYPLYICPDKRTSLQNTGNALTNVEERKSSPWTREIDGPWVRQ